MNKLIRLVAAGDDFTGEFACNLAAFGESTVHALSCAGDHTAIRFLHAALRDQGSVKFRFAGMENVAPEMEFIAHQSYDVRVTHLGLLAPTCPGRQRQVLTARRRGNPLVHSPQ